MKRFVRMIESILDDVRAGRTVVIHCRGGLGRSGLVAASCLVALGQQPKEAIRRVRSARPGAVEVESQERWVSAVAGALEARPPLRGTRSRRQGPGMTLADVRVLVSVPEPVSQGGTGERAVPSGRVDGLNLRPRGRSGIHSTGLPKVHPTRI